MNHGPWSPLRVPIYRALWLAALVSNVGTWMHQLAAQWLMTSLTTSPLTVALLDTAMSFPIFLLALPAGAIGDVVDRRKYLLWTQGWMALAACGLSALAMFGAATPAALLLFTLALGIGFAMNSPVWQSVIPELVSHEDLPAAIALSGISINVARAIGPATGGFILALTSSGFVFLLNAISFLGVLFVLARWKRKLREDPLPAEHVVGAMAAGVRYVRHAPEFRAVLIRAGAFILFGSGFWSLLPVIGRRHLELDALGYGLLVGALGLGAVVMARFLPALRRRLNDDLVVSLAIVLFALAALALAWIDRKPLAYLATFAAGAGWISIMASLNVAAQQSVPAWVRARALAFYSVVFQGGIAAGSILWGKLAAELGTVVALTGAALGMLLSTATVIRFRLPRITALDLTPAAHWPEPELMVEAKPSEGPVLISIEYRIRDESVEAFLTAVHRLARVRRRDGAFEWSVYRDTNDPTRFLEEFLVGSWVEHLRQHGRFTMADRALEDRVRACQMEGTPVRVSHLLYARNPQA